MPRHTYTPLAACINTCIAAFAYGYLYVSYNFLVFSLFVDACIDTVQSICNITAHISPSWHRLISYGQATLYGMAGGIVILHNIIHAHSIPHASPWYLGIFLMVLILAKGYIIYALQFVQSEVSSDVIAWDTIWDIVLMAISLIPLTSLLFPYTLANVSWYAGTAVGIVMITQKAWYLTALGLHTKM